MSECITRVEKIREVSSHFNADRLAICKVSGWNCIIPKDIYKAGDLCVYIPIDSIIPLRLEEMIFENAKVKLSKGRIKTIKLRGVYSQGLVVSCKMILEYLYKEGLCELGDTIDSLNGRPLEEGEVLTELLGITKFEPKVPGIQSINNPNQKKRKRNENFKKYKGMENINNYPNLFKDEDYVIANEKAHGMNGRASWCIKSFDKDTKFTDKIKSIWNSFLGFFYKGFEYEWCVGSHNVQVDPKGHSVFAKAVRQYGLKKKLKYGETIYFEVFGPGIQKNYHYGIKEGEIGCVFYDLRSEEEAANDFVGFNQLRNILSIKELPMPPVIFTGKFKDLDKDELVLGKSILAPTQNIREGIVIRSFFEEKSMRMKNGRKMLKAISPEYLIKDNTDYH